MRQFRARYVLTRWRHHNKVGFREKRLQRKAIEFYIQSLHTRALAGLYQNSHRIAVCKSFERRQALIKFFKRRWLAKCRGRQLLRRVLEVCSVREQS